MYKNLFTRFKLFIPRTLTFSMLYEKVHYITSNFAFTRSTTSFVKPISETKLRVYLVVNGTGFASV